MKKYLIYYMIVGIFISFCNRKKSPTDSREEEPDNTNKVIATIKVGSSPSGVVCIPNTKCICVVDDVTNNLYMVSTENYKIIDSISVGYYPRYIIANDNQIYVSSYGENKVYVVSVSKFKIIDTIEVGMGPFGMCLDSENTLYVVNKIDENISIISGDSVIKTISLQKSPLNVVTISNTHAYVTNYLSNTVSYIDIQNGKIIDTISTTSPYSIAISSDEKFIYVTNSYFNGTVLCISTSTNQIVKEIVVGDYPYDLVITPNNKYLYVVCFGSDKISVVSLENNTTFATIPVGKGPVDIDISSDSKYIYVANHDEGTISVIEGPGNKKIETQTEVSKIN